MYAKIQATRYSAKEAQCSASANGYSNAPTMFDPFDRNKTHNRGLKSHEIAAIQAAELREKIQYKTATAATDSRKIQAKKEAEDRRLAAVTAAAEQKKKDARAYADHIRATIGFPAPRSTATVAPAPVSTSTVVDCWDD